MFEHDILRRTRRRFLRRVQAGMLVAGLTVTAACADASGGAPDPYATPRHGGNVTMLIPGDARGLNPYTANVTVLADGSRLSALYDVLLWSDPATGTVRPQMAESLVPDRDALVWTLTVRQGIRFTDGAQLDAEAVKRAWEKHLDPKMQSNAAGTVKPLTLTVVDKLRLSIKLPSPNANFDRAIAHSLNYIPSPRTLDSDEALATSRTAPVGAGPYKLREWVPGSYMTFERNPGYWQQGKPYLDTITFRVNADTSDDAKTIDSGHADLVVSNDPVMLAEASDQGLSVGEIPLNGGLMLAFNTRGKRPLADAQLRRSIALSLSTDEINRLHYGGKGRPAKGIFDSSSPLANIQLSSPQNNPTEAAALFAKSTDNGRKPLKLTFAAPDSPRSMMMAQYFKQRVELVSNGTVTVEIAPVEISNYSKRVLLDADFDMTTFVLLAEDPEPALFQFLHSKSGLPNLTGYQNPEVDAALEAARLSTDRTVRTDAYTRVQVQLINDMPFFVYQESLAGYIAAPKLTGMQLFNDGLVLWDRIGIRTK